MAGPNDIDGEEGRIDETPVDGQQDHAWTAEEPLETDERLALNDGEERLPWLESADDDYNEYAGSDTGRLLGLVLMGLVALAAIVGGIWWATHRGTDPQLADGSTIEAPAEPYKTAPKDPGGKTFAGTGDSSFAVSEGQTGPAQVAAGAAATPAAGASAAATPGAARPGAATAAGAAAGRPAAASAAPTGGVGVQVGAFSSQATAEAGWSKLVQQSSALAGVPHRVVAGKADIGTVYRLQAVAPDAGAANALCSKLKGAGISCQVK